MSSMFPGAAQGVIQPTSPTGVISKLLDGENYEYKTEITNSLAMSIFDLLGVDNSDEALIGKKLSLASAKCPSLALLKDAAPDAVTLGDYIDYLGARYRINQISKRRKSRTEAVEALKSQNEEENSTTAFRKLMGMR